MCGCSCGRPFICHANPPQVHSFSNVARVFASSFVIIPLHARQCSSHQLLFDNLLFQHFENTAHNL